jgi:23S rRNA-/tRNA-specific pseudouridylate synthase
MGLNAPIVGDRLYGNTSSNEELHLTAKRLRIRISGIQMTFEI